MIKTRNALQRLKNMKAKVKVIMKKNKILKSKEKSVKKVKPAKKIHPSISQANTKNVADQLEI